MIFIPNVCERFTKGFRVTDQNSRVDARVVANVDGRTDGRTNGKPDPYIAPCLRQAGQNDAHTICQA